IQYVQSFNRKWDPVFSQLDREFIAMRMNPVQDSNVLPRATRPPSPFEDRSNQVRRLHKVPGDEHGLDQAACDGLSLIPGRNEWRSRVRGFERFRIESNHLVRALEDRSC